VKYRHKVIALVLLSGMIMLTGLLTPAWVSEQDREKTTLIAQQVTFKEPGRAPLQFMNKIATVQSPSKEKPIIKSTKYKPAPSKQSANPIAKEADFGFVYDIDAPPPPAAPVPPTPPVNEVTNDGFYFRLPLTTSDQFNSVSGAPDPRDRKDPDILRDNKIKMEMDLAYGPRYYQTIKNKAFQIDELEKLEGTIAKARNHQEQFFQEQEMNTMVENLISTQNMKMKPRVQVGTKNLPQKKSTATVIRTIPVENGMTITIIQDESQIEITVKDKQ
jgi:hypothetical protein